MRAYVERQKRKAFEGAARRQSLAVAKRARNSESDEAKSLKELDALINEEQLRDEWKA
ncbi:hypothetical protein QA644_32585 (plasmid) [Rhizobium sp. CC1099]|uniref:hypothetical protein n=1 Tax=Rhizobium sp. CC1099 TaxID=3039160 RepID=UPI0024B1E4A3|nr:hypothetical protein [Rhizobium sp. CC1099]WFU90678.1 hypothetical protein QA644_32585 [Rhizobium sp. CC1099]